MPFVLDCSVTMAWVFPDEANARTDALRELLLSDMAVVPGLWSVEVGNVLLVATRHGRIHSRDWNRIQRALAALPIEIDPETQERIWQSVMPLALHYKLSVYDAVYLELALRHKLPLATLDRELATAVRAEGGTVLAETGVS